MEKGMIKKMQDRLLYIAVSTRDVLDRNNIPYSICYGTLLGAVRHKGFIPWDRDFDMYIFDEYYKSALACLKRELPSDLFVEYFDTEPMYYHGWAHVKDLRSEWVDGLRKRPMDSYQHHGLNIDLYRLPKVPDYMMKYTKTKEHIDYLNRRRELNQISTEEYNERMKSLLFVLEEEKVNINMEHSSSKEVFCCVADPNVWIGYDEMMPLKLYDYCGESFKGPNKYHEYLKRCYGDYMQLPSEEERIVPYDLILK